jgi:hypothetical protein
MKRQRSNTVPTNPIDFKKDQEQKTPHAITPMNTPITPLSPFLISSSSFSAPLLKLEEEKELEYEDNKDDI